MVRIVGKPPRYRIMEGLLVIHGQQLWQRVQRGVEKIRILEISPIARFLVLNWLEPRRERLVPFCGERSHVTENARHLLDANVARKWDCIQTRSADSRIGEQ